MRFCSSFRYRSRRISRGGRTRWSSPTKPSRPLPKRGYSTVPCLGAFTSPAYGRVYGVSLLGLKRWPAARIRSSMRCSFSAYSPAPVVYTFPGSRRRRREHDGTSAIRSRARKARQGFYCSIAFKSLILVLIILIVAIVPMSYRYYQSSYNYELNVLSARLEFIAERGASLIDAEAVHSLRIPEPTRIRPSTGRCSPPFRRIKRNSGVDNAIVMRRRRKRKLRIRRRGARRVPNRPGRPAPPGLSRHLQGHERHLEPGRDDALPALRRQWWGTASSTSSCSSTRRSS